MGAGVLPIAFNGVSILYLLGKEQTNEWSDFGGSSNKKFETTFRTAIREGHEELSGMLGSEFEMARNVKKNYIGKFNNNRYTSYLFHTYYDSKLPIYFNRNYQFVKNTTPYIVDRQHNGLYEKKEIKWFCKDELYELNLRPFYKSIIFPIIENEKKIEILFAEKYSLNNLNNYVQQNGIIDTRAKEFKIQENE